MRRIYKAIGHVILAIIFALLGVVFFAIAWRATVNGLSGDHWKSASTTITYTYTVRPWSSPSSKRSGLEYVLYPHYSFIADDGKTYTGNQYSIVSSENTYRNILTDAEIKRLLVVHDRIFYNPKDPRQSAVEQPYFQPLVVLFFPLGLFVLFGSFKIFQEVKVLYKKKEENETRDKNGDSRA